MLAGRVAIVTGGSRGIGKAIMERLAKEGMQVTITGRQVEELRAAASAVEATGGAALAIPGDAGIRANVEALFKQVLDAWGTVDVLVNNAAWTSPVAHFLEMDEEHWDTVIRTNLKSVYLHCHLAANVMVDQGKAGCIVNISSFTAVRAHRCMAAYDASKGGMEAMSRTMAIDLAPFGIRVNVVQPGTIHTERFETHSDEANARRAQTVPLGRVGKPEDIAAAVAFLASDEASYVTGQVITVDGGMLAQLRPPQLDDSLPDRVRARLKQG